MDTTVSPRIRLFALVGALAAAALAGGMFLLTQQSATAETPLPPPAASVQPTAAPVPAKPKPVRRVASVVAPNGLPRSVASQLSDHRLVVAAIFASGAEVDRLARDEARAGAADANVGFAAVDVSDKRIALALAEKTASLTAPAVLVFGRGGELKARLDGFADRQLVAQLAASAR